VAGLISLSPGLICPYPTNCGICNNTLCMYASEVCMQLWKSHSTQLHFYGHPLHAKTKGTNRELQLDSFSVYGLVWACNEWVMIISCSTPISDDFGQRICACLKLAFKINTQPFYQHMQKYRKHVLFAWTWYLNSTTIWCVPWWLILQHRLHGFVYVL